MPRKVRELIADRHQAGFQRIAGGKGSHRKSIHPRFPGAVTVSGREDADALHYQEMQVKRALEQVQK